MKKALKISIGILLVSVSFFSNSQSIVTTKHNLSVSGTGSVKAVTESEICKFCHTPHMGSPAAPLWNRTISGASYTLYNSSTMNAIPGQPDGSSILCLSCHDGTIALGSIMSSVTPIAMTGTMQRGNLTTDLSNDHPISFVYNASLASTDGQLKTPPLSTIPLDNNSRVQCTSCHDSHKNLYTKFLRASNESSAFCFLCHDRTYWASSTHSSSTSTWNGTGTNPWGHMEFPYSNVSKNACENCHAPHNAQGKNRLLKSITEEGNCLDCHNGNVAASTKNLVNQFAKTYKHNVAGYINIHDPNESNSVTTQHVECVDCHNAHASNATTASAPNINGSMIGVKGINQSGVAITSANYEYEICYKCHAGNTWSPASATSRVISQNNVRLEFATTNPSGHPVAGARNISEITTNLISPNTASTVIYCTACHASDGASSPAGPHGSIYPQILKLQYLKNDGASSANGTTESASAYALCYSCHNRANIINNVSTFPEHKLHIVDQRTPCNTCHDPHGISSTQGTSANNSNLINFRSGVVTPAGTLLRFVDTGVRHGYCQLVCHGQTHAASMFY
ncbi:MAG: hypothetical protein HXX09_01050 [Bacteroidetes bacterium]|nr:hypothetical protein [Bacteroidota bacterium]